MSEVDRYRFMNWRRQRKGRFGTELVKVEVVGRTQAGNVIVRYQRSNLTTCNAIVKPTRGDLVRTIKVELEFPVEKDNMVALLGGGAKIRVSTEAVVDDGDARDAGAEAASVLDSFIEGYGRGA